MTIVALLVALLASSKANNDVEQAQALAGRISRRLKPSTAKTFSHWKAKAKKS